jgi:hypothetical protein
VGVTATLLLSVVLASADAPVRAEIERLRHELEAKPITMEGLAGTAKEGLDASIAALDAGRLYSSLEALRRAEGLIYGAWYATEKEAAVASGLPAFEKEWAEASRALKPGAPGSRSLAAVRALAETSEARIEPLLEGARGFAVATGPKDGLFYIGQAQGEAAFARLCASLGAEGKLERYPLRTMLPELKQVQGKATAAFVPPRSIELHDRFIALNSTIKAGLELDGAEAYAGSAYQYLDAVRHLGMLDAAPLDEAGQGKLREDLAAARAKLGASKRDESLAQLFLERAANQLDHPDGSPPTADEWRSARVILDQVLPAFAAARMPAVVSKSSSAKTVRMTLVRWPYT